ARSARLRVRLRRRVALFPCTTLFRSAWSRKDRGICFTTRRSTRARGRFGTFTARCICPPTGCLRRPAILPAAVFSAVLRRGSAADRKSTTSELQSREKLVCRLLLEKK